MDNDHPYRHLLNNENLQLYIQNGYNEGKGIYSDEPEGPPLQIKQEVKVAKEKFGRIVIEEKERSKRFAEKENRRVMELRREKEEDVACPLCLEDLPAIVPFDEVPLVMHCCGVRLCRGCSKDWQEKRDLTKEQICFSCRRPYSEESVYRKVPNDANEYRKGIALVHMSRDLKQKGKFRKALDCIRKAADLGNGIAYAILAPVYYFGGHDGFKGEQSLEKAKEMAQKGADKGNAFCNYFLAQIRFDEDGDQSEYIRLLSIAAYQGNPEGMRGLALHYMTEAQSEKCMMRATYWSGTLLSTQFGDKYGFGEDWNVMVQDCRKMFVFLVENSMRDWHKRSYFDIEPLPGCSHIPFCDWIRREIRDHEKRHSSNNAMTGDHHLFFTMNRTAWTEICAYCGNREKKKLKKCARCKSFCYCSRECQIKHWKAGHKVDCKGHWIEEFFPDIRNPEFFKSDPRYYVPP